MVSPALALVAVAWPLVAAISPAPPPLDVGAINRFVTSQMGKHHIPGVALVLVEERQVTYAASYGTAGGGRPMSADTPMDIGSTSKLTCAPSSAYR